MSEFFEVLPPDEARSRWLEQVAHHVQDETVSVGAAPGRITARATVDGYAVRAANTFGASDALPAYLRIVGEIPMGQAPALEVREAEAILIHTGGMLPGGANAVVMVEHTQSFAEGELEVLRAVAPGENVLQVGEDVTLGAPILGAGHRLQPQDVGALLAVGITEISVARRPRITLFSTGDELVEAQTSQLRPGQIRDINSGTIQALCIQAGAEARSAGIVPDQPEVLYEGLRAAFSDADMLVVTAGSSVSVRDMTANVINQLGAPGVLVHGVAARPGKPTILAAVEGKPVIGLPGNPVSALVLFTLFGVPGFAYMF
jgi:molybdopterin molybdotransferase